MKKLVLLLLVAGLGAGFYFGRGLLRPPETRACARLSELCGDGEGGARRDRCEQAIGQVRKLAGDEGVDRTIGCLDRVDTCAAAAGCVAGGVGGGIAAEVVRGLGEALGGASR